MRCHWPWWAPPKSGTDKGENLVDSPMSGDKATHAYTIRNQKDGYVECPSKEFLDASLFLLHINDASYTLGAVCESSVSSTRVLMHEHLVNQLSSEEP